jgi:hypothetical protein
MVMSKSSQARTTSDHFTCSMMGLIRWHIARRTDRSGTLDPAHEFAAGVWQPSIVDSKHGARAMDSVRLRIA